MALITLMNNSSGGRGGATHKKKKKWSASLSCGLRWGWFCGPRISRCNPIALWPPSLSLWHYAWLHGDNQYWWHGFLGCCCCCTSLPEANTNLFFFSSRGFCVFFSCSVTPSIHLTSIHMWRWQDEKKQQFFFSSRWISTHRNVDESVMNRRPMKPFWPPKLLVSFENIRLVFMRMEMFLAPFDSPWPVLSKSFWMQIDREKCWTVNSAKTPRHSPTSRLPAASIFVNLWSNASSNHDQLNTKVVDHVELYRSV